MSRDAFVVRAPATTANLGPGFDCAGAALDLWNELEVMPAEEGRPQVEVVGTGVDEVPHDATHLALRAFALLSPLDGYRFRFVNRIPLERGLGSSAATVAAGLVAGRVAGEGVASDRGGGDLLELGLPLEGHADNLAPALLGGVCLVWSSGEHVTARQLAIDLPLDPIVVVPAGRVSTSASRALLPDSIPHAEAAAASAQAALLGAAIASGDPELLVAAFHDRLHEPYRLDDAPLLRELRERPVPLTRAVTLSGSGPSVVVWVEKGSDPEVVGELRRRLPGAQILSPAIAQRGAHTDARPSSTSNPTTVGAAQ